MRRLILLILCAMVALAGCKTGQGNSDTARMTRLAAQRLPVAVPDKTFALVRVDLAKVDSGAKQLTSLAGEVAGQRPEVRHPARSLVSALLRDSSRLTPQIGRTLELPDGHLSGLDTSSTMYVALSTAGNDALLRAMRNQVPQSGIETVPRGLFVRVFLPSAEPEKFASWIDGACEDETYDCDGYERVVARDGGVTVDMRAGSMPKFFEQHAIDGEVALPEDDDAFFGARTVPATSFLESEAALGVYLRSDRIAEVGAVMGMVQAFRALDNTTPAQRAHIYRRGTALAGLLFRAESVEAREIYDSATFFDFDDSGVRIDSISGLTEQGAKVARAAQTPVEMSEVDVRDPLLEAEYGYNLSAALEAAVTPSWMMPDEDGDMRHVKRFLNSSEEWLFLIAAHNYPVGIARGVAPIAAVEGDAEGLAVQQLEYLNGVRMAGTLEPDDASPLGLSPRGGLILHFDRRADIEGWVEQAEEELRVEADELPFAIELDVTEHEGGKEVHVMVGGVGVTGAQTVPSLMTAMIDMAGLSSLVDQLEAGPARQAKMAAPILEKVDRVSFESSRAPSAVRFSVEIGAMDSESFAMPDEIEPAVVTSRVPDCLTRSRRMSSAQMDSLDEVKGQGRPEVLVTFAEEFALKQRECEEAAGEIEWMRAKWLESAGLIYANGLKFDAAVPVLENACELGAESACEYAERAREADVPVRFATVATSASAWVPREGPIPALGVDALRAWQFEWLMGVPNAFEQSLEGIDWSNARQRKNVARRVGEGTWSGFPVMVDPAAEAFALAVMAVQVGEELEQGRWRFRRSRTGPVGIVVPVEVSGQDDLGELTFLPAGDRRPAVRVDVSTEGVDIAVLDRRGPGPLSPIDDCNMDGPTICPASSLEESWEQVVAADPDARVEVLNQYRQAMRVSRVAEQLEKIRFDMLRGTRPSRVRLVVGQDVPFAVVADIAAAVEEAGGDDAWLELAPR